MSASLTVTQALVHAQLEEPTDLAARLEHMRMHLDRCDSDDRAVWAEAIQVTRNGVPSVPEHSDTL